MLPLKNDVLFLVKFLRNDIDRSKEAYGYNILFSYSIRCLVWEAVLKYTGANLDHITDDVLGLLLENIMRGGPSSVWGKHLVKRGEQEMLFEDIKQPICLEYDSISPNWSFLMKLKLQK